MSRKSSIDKIVHIGHRRFLPENHVLRYCGMSQDCCPRGYYEDSQDSVDNVTKLFENFKFDSHLRSHAKPVFTTRWSTPIPKTKTESAVSARARACDGNQSVAVMSETMFNKGYKFSDFKDFVQPAHCDFTEVKKYARHEDERYDVNGAAFDKEFEKLMDASLRKYTVVTPAIRLKVKKNILDNKIKDRFEGSKGLSVYHLLSYRKNRAGIRDSVCWDPFHTKMNVATKIINIMKGEKFKVDKHIQLALCENRFPFIGLKSATITVEPTAKGKKEKKSKKTKRNQYSDIGNSNLIPFTLAKLQQQMVDWRQNCLILPWGHKTSNVVRFIFRQTGYLKGNDKIKWLTVSLKFTLLFSDLVEQYRNLLSLFSDLISNILSPVVTDDYCADLFMQTVEALCLWETMLLDSEQDMVVHELMDIVDSMREFGPVRGWWTLAGERFMAKIKKFCPTGGANCLKVLYHRFISYENNAKFNYTVDHKFIDNIGRYSDNMIKFTGTKAIISNFYWNDWTKNKFYSYLYDYANTLELDEIFLKSPFMRVYETYKSIKAIRNKTWNFWEWLQFVCMPGGGQNYFSALVYLDVHTLSNQEMRAEIKLGSIFLSDMDFIEALYFFRPTIYCSGTIKGIEQRGRGVECSEYKSALKAKKWGGVTELLIPSNDKNDLLKHWNDSNQYSSIVKFNNWKIGVTTKKNTGAIEYGQVNYFFRFVMPLDTILHNLGFSNITARHHVMHTVGACSVPYIKVKITKLSEIPEPPPPKPQVESANILESNILTSKLRSADTTVVATTTVEDIPAPAFVIVNNFRSDITFMSVNFIESTSVAVCGMTSSNQPILLPVNKKGLTTEELNEGHKFCCDNPSQIDRLYLIDLHPMRKLVDTNKFDSTLPEPT